MGCIESAVTALREAGIRVERGFLKGLQPTLTGPACVLRVHKCSREQTVLALDMYCPASMGAMACENAAAGAAEILRQQGGDCTLGECSYDSAVRLLTLRVLAAWNTPAGGITCRVSVDGTVLSGLTGFSARKTAQNVQISSIGARGITVRQESSCWDLTVEELLPAGQEDSALDQMGFVLRVIRDGCTEVYTHCWWQSIRRQETPQGVKQIRVARSWGERSVICE